MKKIFLLSALLIIGLSVSGAKKAAVDPNAPIEERMPGHTPEELTVQPTFNGLGMELFLRMTMSKIEAPTGTSGKIATTFIVDEKGSVDQVEVTGTTDQMLTRRIVRAIQGAKGWAPGEINGQAVRTRLNMTLDFERSRQGGGRGQGGQRTETRGEVVRETRGETVRVTDPQMIETLKNGGQLSQDQVQSLIQQQGGAGF